MTGSWETVAAWWQHGFTEGADPEYAEQLVPLATSLLDGYPRVLDLGCGEGQIARRVTHLDPQRTVVGVDVTWNQIVEAHRRGGGPTYVRGDTTAIPLATSSFDAAVACLVLEHVADLDAATAEIGRVLRPGGRFVLLCNHPLIQTPGSGWIDDQIIDPPEQYWRIGAYLVEDYSLVEVDHDVSIGFHHRPLSRYVNALADAGLVIEHMIEPAPPAGFIAQAAEYAAIATIPRLLVLVTRRR